jgi:hypothetical protein
MNTIHETPSFERPMFNKLGGEAKDETKALGTFAGVIYKALYRSNGGLIPSDTSEQLIADGLNR